MITIGVVGPGYWGSKWIKNILKHPEYNLVWIVNKDILKYEKYKDKYKNTKVYLNIDSAMNNIIPDIVLISTPPSTHLELSKNILNYCSNIIVEKPIGINYNETKELIELCESKNKNIFVDHTYLFNLNVYNIKNIIENGILGDIKYIETYRLNKDIKDNNDVDVIRDLAIHDISLIDFIISKNIEEISYDEKLLINNKISKIKLNIKYNNNITSTIKVGWGHSEKIRKIKIIGSKNTIIWDDINNGPSHIKKNKGNEAIYLELDHIKNVIINKIKPINGHSHINRINSVLNKIDQVVN